jgi:hypothetical protein
MYSSAAVRRDSDTETRPMSRAELLARYWDRLQETRIGERFGAADNSAAENHGRSTAATVSPQDVTGPILLPPVVGSEDVERPSFSALQEWEGYVINIGKSTFLARLTDLSVGACRAEEQVELLIDDLSDDDRAILEPGRVFRWAIGYQRSRSGSKKRVSHIVFRRLPQWTRKELDQAIKEGQEIAEAMKWD